MEPAKQLLLTRVDEEFYGAALWHGALKALDLPLVRIDPESARRLHAANPYMPVSPDLVLAPVVIRAAVEQGLVAAYSIDGSRLRRIPEDRIAREWESAWPVAIRLGQELPAGFAGPEWYVPEENFRWMPKRATLRIPVVPRPGSRLVIAGVTVPEQMKPGPLRVEVRSGGESLGTREITGSGPFELAFELPAALAGRGGISLELEVERTFRAPGDVRDLGLAVGEVEIR
jgi:hypothetical protein